MKQPTKLAWPGFCTVAVVALSLQLTSGSLVAQNADQFIGSESCASCHPQQYEAWQMSAHSRASAVLPEKSRLDKRCAQCHSTMVPNIDPARPEGISNISCERCHGAGKIYAVSNVMKDSELRSLVGMRIPDEKACTVCHSEASPSVKPFNFNDAKAKIYHGKDPHTASSSAN